MLASTTIWSVILALSITGGIGGIFGVIGLAALMWQREDQNRPLIPWGARMRVEREKARLEIDALEVKRIAINHQRNLVLQAVENEDNDTVRRLGLPSAAQVVEDGRWQ